MKLNGKLTTCAVVVAGLLTVSPLFAQSQKWDSSFIPDDTFFSISVNVSNLVNYEKKDSELRKYIEKGFRETANFELGELQQMQIYFSGQLKEGESFDRNGENLMAIKFVFSEPQKVQAIAEKMFGGDLEERVHNGKKYWSPDSEYLPSVFAPSDKTMLVGKEDAIKRLLDKAQSMGEVIDRIKSADGNADVFLTFVQNEMTKEIVAEIAGELEGIPFDLDDIAAEAKYGSLTVSLSAGKPLIGTIVAKDEDGAERLQRAVDALVALGKTFIPTAKKELDGKALQAFPNNEDFKKYMEEQRKNSRQALEITELALEGISTKATGNNVEIEVVAMGGLPQSVKVLGEMIASGMRLSESFRKQQADRVIDDLKKEAAPQEE